jgi:hypothetical protein
MLFPGELYFVPSVVIQDANDKEMQARILIVPHNLFYLDATLFGHDPSDVVGQFWIFAAVFLNDGSSVFERHIDLSELGKIISHEVFDFVAGRFFSGKERGVVRASKREAPRLCRTQPSPGQFPFGQA